jgi:hypothetical protein
LPYFVPHGQAKQVFAASGRRPAQLPSLSPAAGIAYGSARAEGNGMERPDRFAAAAPAPAAGQPKRPVPALFNVRKG